MIKPAGPAIDFDVTHTFSPDQVERFDAGFALDIAPREVATSR